MASNAQLVLARIQAWNRANPRAKLDPNAVLAVARQEGLGGGIGDQGTSFGPWQLHIGGAFPSGVTGDKQAWAWSPAGIDYALRHIATVAGGQTGAQAVSSIVSRFERPANIPREIAGALGALGLPVSSASGYTTGQGRSVSPVQATQGGTGGIDALAALLLQRTFQPPPVDTQGTVQNPALVHETAAPPPTGDALTLARQYLDSTGKAFSNPGFAQYLHGLNGVQLPSSTLAQSAAGTHTSSPKAGDVAFFGKPPSYQGVHLDAGHILHGDGAVLRVTALAHPSYLPGLAGSRSYG